MLQGKIVKVMFLCVAMAAGCSTPAAKQEEPAATQRELEILAHYTCKRLHSPPTVFEDNTGVFGGGARALLMARQNPNGGGEFPFFGDWCLAVAPAELADEACHLGRRIWVLYSHASDVVFLPVNATSPGDVADLYRRVTGEAHPTLKGEMSEDYKAFLEGKR